MLKKISQYLKIEYGLSSRILSIPFHSHYLFFLPKPKVIAIPYAISKDDWPLKAIIQRYGSLQTIINLSWEQLLSKTNQDYKKPKGRLLLRQINYTAWDKSFEDYLLKVGVKQNKIWKVGNPNSAFLKGMQDNKEQIRKKIRDMVKVEKDQRICFLPMNYGWAFMSEREVRHRIQKGFHKEQALSYRDISKKSLDLFTHFVKELLPAYPEIHFVIRPHPGVSVKDYQHQFGKICQKNFLITSEYSASEWILGSDMVASSWSSVVYDAHLIGYPTFLFQPIKLPSFLFVSWMKKIKILKDKDDFKSWLHHEYKNTKDNAFEIEKGDYVKNVADLIMTMCQKNDNNQVAKSFSFGVRVTLLFLFIRALFARLGIRNKQLRPDYFKSELF